jgi:cobalt-zinc-cadmium efflux system protein
VTRERRLLIVFVLNAGLLVGLVVVGMTAHSLGVLAAGGDYVADGAAIALSLYTERLSRRAATPHRSYGYDRSTILAALINTGALIAITALVAIEAVRRLVAGAPAVHGLPVVIVSAVAAVVMLAGVLILRGGAGDDLNMRAVLLDTAGDAVAAGGVAAAGAVIMIWDHLRWVDPAVALLVALVIAHRGIGLLRDVAGVLLESTPKGIDVGVVDALIREDGDIVEVHDLHIWSLSEDMPLLSAHVVLAGHPSLEEAQAAVGRAKDRLAARFGIGHATLETECERCDMPDPHGARAAG